MDTDTLLKKTSRSLYLSVQALPKTLRPTFAIAYLLCRYADTIADTHLLPAQTRLRWITQFPSLIKQQPAEQIKQLTQEISGQSENPYEEALIRQLPLCLEQFNQLTPADQELVLQVVHAVCEGMQIDLSFFPTEKSAKPKAFATAQELEHYCRLMGGKPGLFWSQLIANTVPLKISQEDFFNWGQQIGDALQIVNILRDLPKDLQLGRCYFPAEDIEKAGLTPADLLDYKNSSRFEPIKRKWISWGLKRLSNAICYFEQIPKTQLGERAAVAWPILWTADTFLLLAKEPELLNPAKRVKISRNRVYLTLLCTPALWLSSSIFSRWLNRKISRINQLISQK